MKQLGNALFQQKMGNVASRKSRGKSRDKSARDEDGPSPRPSVGNVDDELEALRQSILRNPQAFVLNNLMMCVPFFGNYEKELEHVRENLISLRESELDKRLPADKHVLLPDLLHEHVARNVVVKSDWQTLLPTIELLQSLRIYVVHDNVEVTEQTNPPQYSSVNGTITYNMLLERTKHEGYVQLRLLEKSQFQKKPNQAKADDTNAMKLDGEFDSDDDSDYGRRSDSHGDLSCGPKKGALNRQVDYACSRSVPDLTDEKALYESRSTLSRDSVYGMHSTYNIKEDLDYEQNPANATQRPEGPEMDNSLRQGTYQRNPKRQQHSKVHWLTNRSPASSVSSGYKSGTYVIDSDSDCGPNTSHADEAKRGQLHDASTSEIPMYCFKKITRMKDGKIYDPRLHGKQLQSERQLRNWNAWMRYNYDVYYASSHDFMQHFVNVFVDKMAGALSFDKEAVKQMKVEGCVINCDKRDYRSKYSKFKPYEIIPAVSSQWPEFCAYEWLYRTTRKSWPEVSVVNKIQELGCYIVPEGFPSQARVGDYMQKDLEWQLTFPAAERYLETCLTHAQVRVYLMAVTLHKTFLQPNYDPNAGLTTSHIRNKLFWLIEQHDRPAQWPENRTGDSLMHLLKSIYQCINQYVPTMEDYFVKNKNLFQRVPRAQLLHAQKQLKRILDNPVMYVFHAMEHLKYSRDFFPKPDYRRLLEILTLENSVILVNPLIDPQRYKSASRVNSDRYQSSNRSAYQKDSEKTDFVRSVSTKTLINTRKDTDCIIEIPERCRPFDERRLAVLLDFFASHFIRLAARCHQYNDMSLRAVYLDQADRLSTLLSEQPSHADVAAAYHAEIRKMRASKSVVVGGQKPTKRDEPPATPKRNAEAPIFVRPFNERFASESPEPASNGEPDRVSVEVHEEPRRTDERVDLPAAANGDDHVATPPETANSTFLTIAESNEESYLSDSTYI